MGYLREISSDKDTHFTTAISGTNGQEQENITRLTSNNITVKGVAIHTDQKLAWDVLFYKTDAFGATDQDADTLCGYVKFANTVYYANPASKTQFVSYSTVDIPYIDGDATNELHVALVNRSSTIKTAGGNGEVRVKCYYQDNSAY